jgi:hypothetical protein
MKMTARDVAEDAFACLSGPSIEFDEQPDLVLRNVPHPHPFYGMALRPRLSDVVGALAIWQSSCWISAQSQGASACSPASASRPFAL